MRGLALSALAFLACGCPPDPEPSADYDQDEIAQFYDADYDGARDLTIVGATFVADAILVLSEPSFVTHNGTRLNPDTGGYYHLLLDGFEYVHRWAFTDTLGRTYVNIFVIPQVALVDPPQRLSASMPVALEFEPPLEPGEGVSIVARDGTEGRRIAWTPVAGASVAEPVEGWEAFLGPRAGRSVDLVLQRWSRADLQEATPGGGEISLFYTSAPMAVAVDP